MVAMNPQLRAPGAALMLLAILSVHSLQAQVRIEKVEFVGEAYRSGYGDNWYTTWAGDGCMYTSMGDGTLPVGTRRCRDDRKKPMTVGGVKVRNNEIFRISGDPRRFDWQRLPGYPFIGKVSTWYGYGMLSIDTCIYNLVAHAADGWNGCKLIYSPDLGKTWKDNDGSRLSWEYPGDAGMFWRDISNRAFTMVTFLQMGKGYEANTKVADGDVRGYVFVYTPNAGSDGNGTIDEDEQRHMVMARVWIGADHAQKDNIRRRNRYEYFVRRNADGSAEWSSDIEKRTAVATFPSGLSRGYAWIPSVIYNQPLDLYLLATAAMQGQDARGTRRPAYLGIYSAPRPWGPWTRVHENRDWRVGGNPGSIPYNPVFAPAWVSDDGKEMWLISSDIKGWGPPWDCLPLYGFNRQKMVLTTRVGKAGAR